MGIDSGGFVGALNIRVWPWKRRAWRYCLHHVLGSWRTYTGVCFFEGHLQIQKSQKTHCSSTTTYIIHLRHHPRTKEQTKPSTYRIITKTYEQIRKWYSKTIHQTNKTNYNMGKQTQLNAMVSVQLLLEIGTTTWIRLDDKYNLSQHTL